MRLVHSPRRAVLVLVMLGSLPALAQSFFAPLFDPDNRWLMRLGGDQPVDVEVSVTVREEGSTQLATVNFKPSATPQGVWLPTQLCLAHTKKGLFFLDDCAGAGLKKALKGRPAIADPPAAYSRAPKPADESDLPLTESVVINREPVLETKVKTISYAFSQDSGFKAVLAEGIGFVSLEWDLQDGGGALALQRFVPAPITAATYEALGIDDVGKAALEAAGGGLQVQGDVGGLGVVTVLLRVQNGRTELVVVGSDGRVRFTQKFNRDNEGRGAKARSSPELALGRGTPRGLRFESAVGEVTIFFDLGANFDKTIKALSATAKGSSYVIGAASRGGE